MNKIKILFVEDNPSITRLFTEYFNRGFVKAGCEFELFTAKDRAEGMDIARREMPDLIFMDIMLGADDGKDVIREMKQTPELQDIPIVVISAYQRQKQFAQEAGAIDFIKKPFAPGQLETVIKKMLMDRLS